MSSTNHEQSLRVHNVPVMSTRDSVLQSEDSINILDCRKCTLEHNQTKVKSKPSSKPNIIFNSKNIDTGKAKLDLGNNNVNEKHKQLKTHSVSISKKTRQAISMNTHNQSAMTIFTTLLLVSFLLHLEHVHCITKSSSGMYDFSESSLKMPISLSFPASQDGAHSVPVRPYGVHSVPVRQVGVHRVPCVNST